MGTKSANRIHRSASKFRVRPNWKMSLVSALHVHCSVPRRRSSYCRSRIWWQMADAAGKRGRPPTAATALHPLQPLSLLLLLLPLFPFVRPPPNPDRLLRLRHRCCGAGDGDNADGGRVARAGSPPPPPPPPVSAPFSTSAAEGGGGRGDLWWLGNFWKCCCRRMEETPKPRWNGKRRMMGKGETRGFVPRLGWMEGRGEATSPREKGREGGGALAGDNPPAADEGGFPLLPPLRLRHRPFFQPPPRPRFRPPPLFPLASCRRRPPPSVNGIPLPRQHREEEETTPQKNLVVFTKS